MEREHIAQKVIPTFEFNPKATQELNGKQKFYIKLPKEVLQSFVDWMTHNPNYNRSAFAGWNTITKKGSLTVYSVRNKIASHTVPAGTTWYNPEVSGSR